MGTTSVKTETLMNGIVIEDFRSIGRGINIKNKDNVHVLLDFEHSFGFYLSISLRKLRLDEYNDFLKELDSMKLALIQAQDLFYTIK
jgi:hypothetical protein